MPETVDNASAKPFRIGARGRRGIAAAGLLALGGAAGAVVMAQTPTVAMVPANPTPIRALASGGIVTVRGRVAEVYGNKFVIADPSGRALVDTGREGDARQLVMSGEAVTVQGRFELGSIHAAFLVGHDNKVTALEPLAGPPRGPAGPHRGPDRGPGAPPPPNEGASPPLSAPADATPASTGSRLPDRQTEAGVVSRSPWQQMRA